MDDILTLKQIAQHLQVSERTIFRLLERGELPAFKVGGHWRFRRGVVDYWLDLRMGRMGAVELLDFDPGLSGSPFPLSDALSPRNALILVPEGNRRVVIQSFIAAVQLPDSVDPGEVLDRVWSREELASTALSDGAALLHTSRWETRTLRQENLFAIGRLAGPVDFGAVDGERTDLLFLVLAGSTQQHLSLLARTTRLCRHPGFLSQVRQAESPAEVQHVVRRTEGLALKGSAGAL